MTKRGLYALSTAALLVATSGQALAGGLERGGYNIDLLFDPSRIVLGSTATFVMPERELNNVQDINPVDGIGSDGIGGGATNGVKESESYWVPRVGVKANLFDGTDCLAQYSQPWGAHTNPGADWMGANHNIETKVESDSYDLTCSYTFGLETGQFRLIGGGFYQEVSGFKERLVLPVPTIAPGLGSGVGRLDLEGDGWGYRLGMAYEIPEIALRASLVYNSEVELDNVKGTLDLTEVPSLILPPGDPRRALFGFDTPVNGAATMPQSVELKVQSGIAPGWLAFGSVKWVDWSVLQVIPFYCSGGAIACPEGSFATSLDLAYRDGWTISGGVGHQFNDQLSGLVALTWDRGTSDGFGSQTDTWSVSGGVAYKPTEMVELQLGGALGLLTSGSSGVVDTEFGPRGDDISYDFGNDFVGALQAGLKVRF